ncbi:dihydrolipoyl dehydrogenase family protein [Lactiplantibacillus plantarum]|uniref:dihydrolipoyl dehydrogenase family protein n=1 Tax=Lactiplantibacillus plantarum TaxID=1590 RepID=UPI001363B4F7|nr:NAD(P)/FAD-dependent oxidoreductase [Lactiplantibacillus plantarum]MCS8588887.1 NAD(P)/FAD-dependent oxidoreductase [Lactiplantibacillus plantarum]QHM41947.1 Glutathione amide reductase [Lactiplantibacillus plantarum]QHM49121.1 Glutathione amide reductase [Lactiplantibacillus plantarum]
MSEKFDVVYLGSGHGTFDGAIPLAACGKKVAVIEADLIGGTCPNRGCNAKITLDQPVALKNQVANFQGYGLRGEPTIDWQANFDHERDVIAGLPDMIAGLMTSAGVTLINGRGTFVDDHTIQVADKTYTADKIVIATGQHPHRLDIPGTELAHDSNDFLNLTTLPHHITVIGAGYIGLEFANMALTAGSQVTLLMRGDQALRQFHQPFVERLLAILVEQGLVLKREWVPTEIKSTGDHFEVLSADDKITTDWILDATGRQPNTANLGLERIGVDYTAAGITVDDHLQTSVAGIYASGDVLAKDQPKLTPTAIFESQYLTHLFTGDTNAPIKYPAIPSVVFTSPRLAQVGTLPTSDTHDVKVTVNDLKDDWFRQTTRDVTGHNLLVTDDQHRLIGAAELGEQAENTINTLLPAIQYQLTPAQREQLVTLFPSIGAAVWSAI